jgi:hypothetical protein
MQTVVLAEQQELVEPVEPVEAVEQLAVAVL